MRKSIQLIRTLLIVKMVTRKYKDATTGSVKGGLRFKRLGGDWAAQSSAQLKPTPWVTSRLSLFDLLSILIKIYQTIARSPLQSVLCRQLKGYDWPGLVLEINDIGLVVFLFGKQSD